MRAIIAVTAVLLTPAAATAAAQAMNAEEFYKRATALQNKGPLALFSRGEIRTLMKEVQASAGRACEQRLAAAKAGQKPRYCPPEAAGSLDSKEFMTRLSAIPPAERTRINMTEATTRVLAGKFPCPRA